jgi:hypothetical protein
VKIVIDYDDDAERKRLEAFNEPGTFPLVFEHVDDFVLCGIRSPGAAVQHVHGNPYDLITQTAALSERLRTTITQLLMKEAASGREDP